MKTAAALSFFCFTMLSPAVEFRAASFNIGAHFTSEGFPDYSLGDPGTPDHDSVKAVLGRINADVVALQEIASRDVSGNPDDLDALALSLGYPYIYLAPVTDAAPLKGPIDTSLRVIFLSRHPFLSTTSIRSPDGAKEITRLLPSVKIDVPGTTRDPLLISAHLKSGTATADRFRRAVEMRRLSEDLAARGLTEDDNFIILGDFNLSSSNTTFTSLPSGLPTSFVLGADVTLPLTYSTNPIAYFTDPGVARLDPRQLNGSAVTFPTSNSSGGNTIDLFLVSPAFAGRPMGLEIYNSALDTSNLTGLQKAGAPLAPETSATASDHLALFGDFELDADFPNLDVAFSVPTVTEGSADGSAMFMVTLPATRATSLTVTITPDDPSVATTFGSELIIPAGSLTASTAVRTVRNFIQDAQRSVAFTASAIGYDPDSAVLQVDDVDGPYVFTAPGQTVSEAFTGFNGAYDPAPWVTTGGAWQGVDAGTAATSGLRSYGSAGDGSIGVLADAGPVVATAGFTNGSATVLTAVQVSFTAEQWKAALGGRAATLAVDLVDDGGVTALPALSFSADTSLPSGAVAGGTSEAKNVVVTGLAIAPGASFELRFTVTPGPGGGALPGDVFLNELHYDNDGIDSGEFIEVVVGPGYSGQESDISIVLYNGSGGANYGTHALSTFIIGELTESKHQFYSKLIPGIQNGNPDGIALVVGGVVKQFISYGGSFTATAGAATGMISSDIGIKQTTNEVVGQAALGLTGTGAESSNFVWTKFTGIAHSPGQLNSGQSLVNPVLPPQGIAIDSLSVTFLVDTDGDGLPDITDPDDDNDGMSDADELVFGTDPLGAASRFAMGFTNPSPAPGNVRVSFPTAAGRTYVVESSPDLSIWTGVGNYAGTGSPRVVDIPVDPEDDAQFYRIRASLP